MREVYHQSTFAKSSVFLYRNLSTERIFRGSENEWYDLYCRLDVRGCDSDLDNKVDRSSSHSIQMGSLASGMDDKNWRIRMNTENIILKRSLVLQSFAPLFILLAIKHIKLRNIYWTP